VAAKADLRQVEGTCTVAVEFLGLAALIESGVPARPKDFDAECNTVRDRRETGRIGGDGQGVQGKRNGNTCLSLGIGPVTLQEIPVRGVRLRRGNNQYGNAQYSFDRHLDLLVWRFHRQDYGAGAAR
jgi:hypothetical protein